MTKTYTAIMATKNAYNDKGSTTMSDVMTAHKDFIETRWHDYISEGNSNYTLKMYKNSTEIVLDGTPGTKEEALDLAQDDVVEKGLDDTYDSIVVLDTRSFSGGIAYVGTAGGEFGVGMNWDLSIYRNSAHELGHNYNATHADSASERSSFESTCCKRSIMGDYGQYDCNDNQSFTSMGKWYADCAQNHIRSYIDNNL